MPLLIDSGFLYAVVDRRDQNHKPVIELLPTLADETMILPIPVLVETSYLIQNRLSHAQMRQFLADFLDGPFQFESILDRDLRRIYQLLEKYGDAKLDFVDASITALAERLKIQTILTVDQRDFRMIRPAHCTHFNILP